MKHSFSLVLCLVSLLTSAAQAEDIVKIQPGPAEAQAAALSDLNTIPILDRAFTRYVFIPPGKTLYEDIKSVSFTLNWLSNSGVPYRPPVIGGKQLLDKSFEMALVRVNLRNFVYDDKQLDRWLKTWENLTFDPNFSILITADTIQLLADAEGKLPAGVQEIGESGKMFIDTPVYEVDGKKFKGKWVTVIRTPAGFLDPKITAALEQQTQSTAPVVHFQYFSMRALASVRDAGLFTDVFGGEYYNFAGVRTAKQAGKKKATDLDTLFEDLGIIDDADGNVKAQDKLDKLLSEQRVAMLHSQVTGKRRVVFIIPTGKTVRKRGVLFITGDIKDQNIDLNKNIFANLLDFKPDAREAIWVDSNGSQKYALFNADGVLQQDVPPDVAVDHGIPEPYTRRLQTVGCVTCHGTKGHDGWQPLPNEVLLLKRSLDLRADVSNKKGSVRETIGLIASKYGGDADDTLMDLRRGTIGSVLQMVGPYGEAEKNKVQTDVYSKTATKIDDIRRYYWYTRIDAKIALAECGIDAGKAKPIDVLKDLLPPDVFSKNDSLALVPEDVMVAQLLSGRSIGRTDWELRKGFVQTRIHQTLTNKNRKEQKK